MVVQPFVHHGSTNYLLSYQAR